MTVALFWAGAMQGGLEPGYVVAGEYRVVRAIGAGGMGAVYEVEQLSTRKRRALKVLGNRFGRDERAQTRFVREATVGASIESEHVVEVIGAGVEERSGLPWLAMELLDGVDLKRLLNRRAPLGPWHTRVVFQQLGHGLAAAHRAGVIHRDLKPENVFIARSRRAGSSFTVKILDFGIAKITRESVITTDTATIGSPMWMAPEQINADPLSPRTDVWALGLLAFWALTRRVYWKAAYGARVTVQALFAEQLFAELVPASVRAAEYGCEILLPPEFDAWFGNCVVRDVEARFADAGAAVNAFASVLERPAAADPTRETPLLPPREQAPAQRQLSGVPVAVNPDVDSLEMAGTTADVLGRVDPNHTAPSEAAIGLHATHSEPGMANQPTMHPAQLQSGPRTEPARRGTSPGKLAALVAIPAVAIIGAGVTIGVTQFGGDDDDVDPPQADVERPERTPEPPPPPPPRDPGVVDLEALPRPASVAFLGWTADGESFAVRAAYGHKLPRGNKAANYAEFVHVVGSERTESFVVDRVAADKLARDDALVRAVAAGHRAEDWTRRRLDLLLQPPDPRRAPRRAGELRLQLDDVPPGSRVRTDPKVGGFDVSWWRFDPKANAKAPRMKLVWHEGEHKVKVLDEALAVREQGDGDSTLRDEVRVFWSPDETRCVVVVDQRWFVRDVPARPG